MKWPLVQVVLGYAAGLILADVLRPEPVPLFAASFVLALLACCLPRLRPYGLWPLIVLVGCTNLAWRTAILSPHDLRAKRGIDQRLVEVRGILLETPTDRVWVRGDKESWRFVARLDVSGLRTLDGPWEAATGILLVNTLGRVPNHLFGGQTVEVEGLLSAPPPAAANGLFDYRKYLARQNIYFILRPAGGAQWRCLRPVRQRPFTDAFLAWAQRTLALDLPAEDETLSLLWAMTLGWKGGVDTDFYEPFMLSGTMHVFAISGLHIVLIAGFLSALAAVARVPRAVAGCLVIPLIWFYTWATGWQPSAIRATIMVTVLLLGYALRRPSNLVNSLAAAAWIILLWDPQQLFGASFQLSFCVVLALGVLGSPLTNWLRHRVRFHDPLLPEKLVPPWKRVLARAWWKLAAPSIATTIAACAGVLPLTAQYFHVISPVTLVANLIVVPLSSLALAANLGSLITGVFAPVFAGLLNHSAWAFMYCMVEVSRWAAELPFAYRNVTSPPWLFHAGWYGGLTLMLLQGRPAPVDDSQQGEAGLRSNDWMNCGALWPLRGTWRWAWGTVGVCLVASLVQWSGLAGPAKANLHVLPLEGGVGVLAEFRGEGVWLIDPGNREPAEKLTKPFLRSRGIDSVHGLFLTHGDSMHVGGAAELARSFPPERVLTTGVRQRSARYREVVADLSVAAPVKELRRGDQEGPWRILHPAAGDRFSRADDAAIVLLAEFWGTRVLLLSDLGYAGQRRLLEHGGDLRADIVVAGLPSVGEPLCEALLDAVRPSVIVLGDSDFRFGTGADAALRARLGKRGVALYRTGDLGAVSVEITRKGHTIAAATGR